MLLYSGSDFLRWKRILEKQAQENQWPADLLASALKHVDEMDRYARGAACRHRALVEHFGQTYPAPACHACDLCLGDTEEVPDAAVVAQKILSCVARVKEGYGIGHVIDVLKGKDSERIRQKGHDRLTTFGLLTPHSQAEIRDWVYQLLGQGVLAQVGDEYPVLKLNAHSWEVMRGQRSVRLVQLVRKKKGEKPQRSRTDTTSWEGVDRELFEVLRTLRRRLAEERQVPPYVVFGDATLRELARVRPSTAERMRRVYGVGDAKLRDFGEAFLGAILTHCEEHRLSQDR